MPAIKIVNDGKGVQLLGCTLCYGKIDQPRLKYESEDRYEYSVDVVVDQEMADELEMLFPKNKIKKVRTSDFEGIFKIAPPLPSEKFQYVFKAKDNAQYLDKGTGKLVMKSMDMRPRVGRVEDGKVVPMTTEKFSNGSVGDVYIKKIESSRWGDLAYLDGVILHKFIPFESQSYSGFGDVFGSHQEVDTKTSDSGMPDVGVDDGVDDFDDEIPF